MESVLGGPWALARFWPLDLWMCMPVRYHYAILPLNWIAIPYQFIYFSFTSILVSGVEREICQSRIISPPPPPKLILLEIYHFSHLGLKSHTIQHKKKKAYREPSPLPVGFWYFKSFLLFFPSLNIWSIFVSIFLIILRGRPVSIFVQ